MYIALWFWKKKGYLIILINSISHRGSEAVGKAVFPFPAGEEWNSTLGKNAG